MSRMADTMTEICQALGLPEATHVNELPAAVTKALKESYDKGYAQAEPGGRIDLGREETPDD
jgi:hypothetical protein